MISIKIGLDISCKLSQGKNKNNILKWETVCMKCQILFSWENKKNILKCKCLLKILPRVLSIKNLDTITYYHTYPEMNGFM